MGDADYQNYQDPIMGSTDGELEEVVSVGRYLWFFLMQVIPIVNIVYPIVKAFSSNENKSYRNLCRLWCIIMIIEVIVVVIALGAAVSMFKIMSEYGL